MRSRGEEQSMIRGLRAVERAWSEREGQCILWPLDYRSLQHEESILSAPINGLYFSYWATFSSCKNRLMDRLDG